MHLRIPCTSYPVGGKSVRQFVAPVRVVRAFPLLLALCAVFASAQASSGAAPVAVPDVSVFYYPWYGTPPRDGGWVHWMRPDTTSYASNYYPARGLYSSSNARVVLAQMQEIAGAGIQEVVSSWWGLGSPEDRRLQIGRASCRERVYALV